MRAAHLLALAVTFTTLPAFGASFDCGQTRGWRENLICASPKLSALDGQLGRAYQSKRAILSKYGASLLQKSQRSWLSYVDTVCPRTPASTEDSRATPAACLQLRYQDRLSELAKVAYRVGPFVFNRIDLFAAEGHDALDQSGSVPGFYVQHLAFLQIDNVESAAVADWNRANYKENVSKTSSCDVGLGDEDDEVAVGYANHHVISVKKIISEYCHGTPHGMFGIAVNNSLLTGANRELNSSDVFAGEWRESLKKLFWKALTAKGWTPPDNQADVVRDEIDSVVIDPARWFFTKEGLSVPFSAYEGGCYACNPGTTIVKWKDLRPLLSTRSVFSDGGGNVRPTTPMATKSIP